MTSPLVRRVTGILALLLAPAFASAARAPNLIVILADDLGSADLGHDGSQIDTPNLDRMAKQGVKLTHFHSSAPMCSPTRAALLTGRYPHSVGVPELASPNAHGNVPILALDHQAVTIPEALKSAGYRSSLVGKWHLGHAKENWPRTHGFDEFWGSLIGTPMYWQVKETFHNETPIEPKIRSWKAGLGASGGGLRGVLAVIWNNIFQLRRSCADPLVEAEVAVA